MKIADCRLRDRTDRTDGLMKENHSMNVQTTVFATLTLVLATAAALAADDAAVVKKLEAPYPAMIAPTQNPPAPNPWA